MDAGSGTSSSSYYWGWNIIRENGCPSVPTWGGMAGDPKRWMTGYDNYFSGMYNKVASNYHIDVDTPGGLEILKHWINDHNAGTEIGGLACFHIFMGGNVIGVLPPESAEAGKKIIADYNWNPTAYHAMTFVGYNDNIKYDVNNDGLFTNDFDTNGDGVVDMLDWEVGALKIANSWNDMWPTQIDEGFIYLPYRLLPKKVPNPINPLHPVYVIDDAKTHVIIVKTENNPELVVKANVQYPCRKYLELKVGYASNSNQGSPIEEKTHSSFKCNGGCLPMQGFNNYDPIEVGLDFGHWFSSDDVGKIFFIIKEYQGTTPYDGTINYFSIIDNRWGESFELYCDATNVPVVNDGETVLSINYDLIPHEVAIDENLSLFSNMVSRFNPTVTNGATLTIEDGVGIDMYDSEIHIMAGSTLVIEDNAVITAKRGRCKLIIDGNLICGSNVRFDALEDADLELLLNNNSLQVTFGNSSLERIRLDSYAQSLTISNSEFRNCIMISSHRGNVTVTNNCTFIGTGLYVENTEDNNNTATISNCSFTNNLFMAAIDMWNYNQYDISNNTINGFYNGIQIVQSGYGLTKKQTIQDNTITNCSQKGILAYNTLGSVYRNHISNNNYGVWFGDHSGIKLYGNSGAISNNQTQEIYNNTSTKFMPLKTVSRFISAIT